MGKLEGWKDHKIRGTPLRVPVTEYIVNNSSRLLGLPWQGIHEPWLMADHQGRIRTRSFLSGVELFHWLYLLKNCWSGQDFPICTAV